MRPVVTPAEMGELDRRTIEAGTPEAVLVERAGTAVAWHARRLLGGTYGRRVVVACGKGNNGADGRVAARVLRGWGVRVVESGDRRRSRSRRCRSRSRADLFVDAMFGTGFRGALEGDAAWLADAATPCAVLAVDIPSGVDGLTGAVHGTAVRARDGVLRVPEAGPAVRARPIVRRRGRGRRHRHPPPRRLVGLHARRPPPFEHLGHDRVGRARARRARPTSTSGAAVLVVGGSAGMIGAPGLTARAALRTGSGMVVAAVPGAGLRASEAERSWRARCPRRRRRSPAPADELLGAYVERFKAVALGPGLGRAPETAAAVARLVAEAPVPMVIDADALNAARRRPDAVRPAPRSDAPTRDATPSAGRARWR